LDSRLANLGLEGSAQGMPKHRQRVKENEDDGAAGDTIMVYNAVKAAVGFSELVRKDR